MPTQLSLMQDTLAKLVQLEQAVLDLERRVAALEEVEQERKKAYEGFLGQANTLTQTQA